VRGNSILGPDPAGKPEDSKPLWRAKRIDELSDGELYLRLLSVTDQAEARGAYRFAVMKDGQGGDVSLIDIGPGKEAQLAALEAPGKRRCFARDAQSVLVVEGASVFLKPDFVKQLLDGMPAIAYCR
jgi:hypothetical protein